MLCRGQVLDSTADLKRSARARIGLYVQAEGEDGNDTAKDDDNTDNQVDNATTRRHDG